MSIEPDRVGYIDQAGEFLGNAAYESIDQIAESIELRRQNYRVMEQFRGIKAAERTASG